MSRQPGVRYPSEWAACTRCGRDRMVNAGRPARLCRDCYAAARPCPKCGVLVSGCSRGHRCP